jgi:hypothetical protein
MPYSKSNKKIQDSAFKMKGYTYPGVSPMRNDKTATGGDPKLEKLKAKRIANTKAGKIIKFGEGSNIIADKGPIDPWSSELKKGVKKGTKVAKKVVKKAVKVAGSKTLGVLGFMGAGTLSATATPKNKAKKKGSYTDDFTKLRK